MASVMIQGDDGKIAVHVYYSIMSGEVWHFSVGKIVFVDQESGVLRPGWKRALVRQALRRPHIDFKDFAFWTEELATGVEDQSGQSDDDGFTIEQ